MGAHLLPELGLNAAFRNARLAVSRGSSRLRAKKMSYTFFCLSSSVSVRSQPGKRKARSPGVRRAQYWGLVERYCQNERNAKGCLINHHVLLQITKIWRQDATLLPIILYTDGTWLSKNGAHNAKPLSMTIGNFPRHVMNKNKAKTVRWTPKLDKNLKFFVVFCCHLGPVLHAQSQCAKKAKAVQGFQGIQARSIS